MFNIVKDEFNSNIFKMKMGNLIIEKNYDLNVIIDKAKKDKYEHLSIKIDTTDLKLCNLCLNAGFYIVDTLVSYRYDYRKNIIPEYKYFDGLIISDVEKRDIDAICSIAYNSFFNDRFHNDPFLSDDLCNTYYEQWIRNSCNGFADTVLVCKDRDNNILGFGTGKYQDVHDSALVLNAVTNFARGKGVYTAMIFEAMKRYRGKSQFLNLGTQINNYAVQKAWGKLGFQLFDSKYVLHKKIDYV